MIRVSACQIDLKPAGKGRRVQEVSNSRIVLLAAANDGSGLMVENTFEPRPGPPPAVSLGGADEVMKMEARKEINGEKIEMSQLSPHHPPWVGSGCC